jgi:hypothetical protein
MFIPVQNTTQLEKKRKKNNNTFGVMIYNAAIECNYTCIHGKEMHPLNLYYRQFAVRKHANKIAYFLPYFLTNFYS